MPPRSSTPCFRSFTFVAMFGATTMGCTLFDEFFDESVTLAELKPASAVVSVELSETSRSQLVLHANEETCPTMTDDIGANIDGKSMDVFIKGGKQPSGKGWICGLPTFRRNVAATDLGAASTTFVVDDDATTMTVVATGLLLERALVPTIKDVPVVAGVDTSFEWSVPTDVISADLFSVDFVYDDSSLALGSEITARVEGSLVLIRFPVDAPIGKGKLKLNVTADVPVEKCEGVPTCKATVHALTAVNLEVIGPVPPGP